MSTERFDALVKCIGFERTALTKEQRAKIGAFIESQPVDALLGVYLYPNLDCTRDDNVPSGMKAFFNVNAIADPTVLSDEMFQVMAANEIKHGALDRTKLTDEDFAIHIQDIQSAIQQFPEQRASGDMRTHKNKETRYWTAELGGPGSFAGIYSELQEDHRSKKYYAVVRATVPELVRDWKDAIHKAQPPPTYADLLRGEAWRDFTNYAQKTAHRNACRGLMCVAEACQTSIMRTTDIHAYLSDPNHAQPELAVPDTHQVTHSIAIESWNGHPAVAISHGVTSVLGSQDRFLVVSNPYDGIYVFPLTNVPTHDSAPCDTGRAVVASALPLTAEHYQGRTNGVAWEGDHQAMNPDLHPKAFKPVDTVFRAAMKSMGWNAEHHVGRLVPVSVKIWSDAADVK